jgi:Uma2 family endonuclease
MTAEEFCAWVQRPENEDRRWELVRGELIEMPREGRRHGFVCAGLAYLLQTHSRQQGCGYALCNYPGIVLERNPDTVRGPDVVFIEKSKPYEELATTGWIEEMPELTVEVLSPNDQPNQVTRRVNDFLRAGVRMVWVVDPETRKVAVHRALRPPFTLDGDQQLTGDDVLPDFRCRVSDLFSIPGEDAKTAG